MNGYDTIKAKAEEHGLRISDLLVLARQNDPFFAGQPSQQVQAEWFADLWARFGFARGVHLRRIHYRLVSSDPPIIGFNGEPYRNTVEDWQRLTQATKAARYLDLVEADAFEDRRNPDPHLIVTFEHEPSPGCEIDPPESWQLPSIETDIGAGLDIDLPEPVVYGYDYRDCDQPFHLEVWIEKSTMNDVLLPICRRYGVNLVTSVGFQSITSAIGLVRRAVVSRKPVRIFYISDFDPAGDFMPQSVARQIEYWSDDFMVDIALHPLALTRDQVIARRLPRIPVKASDRRKANFEECYGEGAVELDALEALHPGELGNLLVEAIAPYRDPDLERDMSVVETEAEEHAAIQWCEYTEQQRVQLDAITEEVQAVYAKYRDRLADLKRSLDAELEPLQDRLDAVRQAIHDKAEEFAIGLPQRPVSDLTAPEQEHAWLFDTKRDYFEQLQAYKSRRQ